MQGHNMDRSSDAALVDAAREGDLDAFTALLERYRTPALRVAYGIAGNEAEDAVQEAFVKAYRKLGDFRADAAFRPWLFTIVANEARNRRRSLVRRGNLEMRVRAQPRFDAANVADTVARHDERQRLLDVVAQLPERHREIIALRFLAGLSETETAEILAAPVGTVKSRLSRALDLLRSRLGEEVAR
jgi:RNA polymerase sigma factor (sigma-70 family)